MKKYYHLIGIIILIVVFLRIDFQKILVQLSKINLIWFALINLLILPTIFLKAYRWKCILGLQKIDYSMKDSFFAYLGGIFAGIVTPGRIGEAMKVVYLKEDKGVSGTASLVSIFIDRLFDLYLLVLLGEVGLILFLKAKGIKYDILIFVFILFLVVTPFLLWNKYILEKIVKVIYKSMISGIDKKLFDGQFKNFFGGIKKIITQPIYSPIIFTILAYLFYFGQCYLLSRLLLLNLSFMTVVSFVSISSIISLLPITVLGIGTRELSLIYLFSLLGIRAETALAYSFLLFISFYAVTAILAFLGWYIKGKR